MANNNLVAVVGSGLMGTGIAAVLATRHPVLIYDVDPQRVDAARNTLDRTLDEMLAAGLVRDTKKELSDRIHFVPSLQDLAPVQFVFEAIIEKIETKQELYSQLEAIVSDDTILASNTSGFMPSALASRMRRPERFLVAHFWNPPHAIPLVEVVPNSRTTAATLSFTTDLLTSAGAQPVVLKREIQGFIGNRLQYAVLREALHLVAEGIASAADVDRLFVSSLGRRYGTVGPIETADLGGLDTFYAIASHLMPELAKSEDCLELMRAHVERGEVGARSGKGFYEWTAERLKEVVSRRNQDLLRRHVEEMARIGQTKKQ
jgi:3-hydroxybutyryl-CoA dehydrogenase